MTFHQTFTVFIADCSVSSASTVSHAAAIVGSSASPLRKRTRGRLKYCLVRRLLREVPGLGVVVGGVKEVK
jgi:hypothetical protein